MVNFFKLAIGVSFIVFVASAMPSFKVNELAEEAVEVDLKLPIAISETPADFAVSGTIIDQVDIDDIVENTEFKIVEPVDEFIPMG